MVQIDALHTAFRNPKKGGLYKFDLNLNNKTVGALQVRFPAAGPDISDYWQKQINYFHNVWGPAYRKSLDLRVDSLSDEGFSGEELYDFRRSMPYRDMLVIGPNLDWGGNVYEAETSCIIDTGYFEALTLKGYTISWSKRNNMLFALIGREVGLTKNDIKVGALLRNFVEHPFLGEGDETRESYQAGFDLFNGAFLDTVMQTHGLKMHQPNGSDDLEWPSHEITKKLLYLKNLQQVNGLITQ